MDWLGRKMTEQPPSAASPLPMTERKRKSKWSILSLPKQKWHGSCSFRFCLPDAVTWPNLLSGLWGSAVRPVPGTGTRHFWWATQMTAVAILSSQCKVALLGSSRETEHTRTRAHSCTVTARFSVKNVLCVYGGWGVPRRAGGEVPVQAEDWEARGAGGEVRVSC